MVDYGEKASFLCSAMSGHWGKLAARLSRIGVSSSLNASMIILYWTLETVVSHITATTGATKPTRILTLNKSHQKTMGDVTVVVPLFLHRGCIIPAKLPLILRGDCKSTWGADRETKKMFSLESYETQIQQTGLQIPNPIFGPQFLLKSV